MVRPFSELERDSNESLTSLTGEEDELEQT